MMSIKSQFFTIDLFNAWKKKRIEFSKIIKRNRSLFFPFTHKTNFYGSIFIDSIWVASNLSYNISVVRSKIKINAWRVICYN